MYLLMIFGCLLLSASSFSSSDVTLNGILLQNSNPWEKCVKNDEKILINYQWMHSQGCESQLRKKDTGHDNAKCAGKDSWNRWGQCFSRPEMRVWWSFGSCSPFWCRDLQHLDLVWRWGARHSSSPSVHPSSHSPTGCRSKESAKRMADKILFSLLSSAGNVSANVWLSYEKKKLYLFRADWGVQSLKKDLTKRCIITPFLL